MTGVRDDLQLLIKPAGADCNLRCSYCFYLPQKDLYAKRRRRRMDDETLQALVRGAMSYGASCTSFTWQGGEPTLMGLDFYERAVEQQILAAAPGQRVNNCLQTNGLVLDDEWCSLLADAHFLVGLSIDGPEEHHDRYRVDRRGRGSHAQVAAVAERLARHGVETNAMVLLTEQSAADVGALWESLLDLGLRHLQFIPCLEVDPKEADAWTPFSLRPESYGRVLCELFDRWRGSYRDGRPTVYVRFFEALLFGYIDRPVPLCWMSEACGDELVVEALGDVYPCDFFVEQERRLGNVRQQSVAELMAHPERLAFVAAKSETLDDVCKECPFLQRCYGGCPKDRQRDTRSGHNPYCRAYKTFFAHADSELRALAGAYQRGDALLG